MGVGLGCAEMSKKQVSLNQHVWIHMAYVLAVLLKAPSRSHEATSSQWALKAGLGVRGVCVGGTRTALGTQAIPLLPMPCSLCF